ncbi:MAG: pantoate--beta-alanine ligase [Tenuifilaceae bacterium]|jgi:pantoate--beta-alanine ligase|nr:pantoate--beta-alanine ligase [Tenuifilaceae bacterium]
MKTVNTIGELKSYLNTQRDCGRSVGFVPTMGALHQGHTELMRTARQHNDVVVVSVFVNPTQFNNPNDLRNYPRTLDQDLLKCEQVGVDLVFVPTVQEMYPEADTRKFDFGHLDKVMEGKHRPGHFNGVAQVVSKLFDAVNPTRAYFGQKDFQQLAVVRELAKTLRLDVEIVGCPTVREEDGLAMSSRNMLLSPEQRKSAPLISKTLFEARNKKELFSVKEMISWVIGQINSDPELNVEYFEIANANTLETINQWSEAGEAVGCIAVQVGDVRLIDNILF